MHMRTYTCIGPFLVRPSTNFNTRDNNPDSSSHLLQVGRICRCSTFAAVRRGVAQVRGGGVEGAELLLLLLLLLLQIMLLNLRL